MNTFTPFRLIRQNFDKLAVVLTNSPPPAVMSSPGGIAFPADWAKIWNSANIRLCTDGAANRLLNLCSENCLRVPDIIVGDFDSITDETRQYFSQFPTCEQRHVLDQDSTDLTKAFVALMDKVPQSAGKHCNLSGIVLLGGFHGRFDHVLGALHVLLLQIQQWPQVPLFAIDDENVLTVLPEGRPTQFNGEMLVELDAQMITGTCGLFPLEQKPLRLTTKGFRWNLTNESIAFGQLVSSSNHILCPEGLSIESVGGAVVFTFELREPNTVF